jgi:transcriptional regulator with XRE-family HTH domain
MTDSSLGSWLRREREQRGITIRTIADQTKVAAPLLEGLESGDLSRWPGGIYRRAFVKAYASALGLDPDDVVKRFELEHPPADAEPAPVPPAGEASAPAPLAVASTSTAARLAPDSAPSDISKRSRLLGTAADLTVALVLGLGSAAAGSRLLWPVLLIAGYYAIGILLTGTSPMVALLNDQAAAPPAPATPTGSADEAGRGAAGRPADRRHQSRRGGTRVRPARGARTRVQ